MKHLETTSILLILAVSFFGYGRCQEDRRTNVQPGSGCRLQSGNEGMNPPVSEPPQMDHARVLQGRPVKIVLVGDSTVAAEGGWGPGFCMVLTANVTCLDRALNGRSSKSFIDEGAWTKALAEHGDYYLIQFGHNDQKPDPARHTDADGSFGAYLKRYIADVRRIGAVPVLITPLSRRTFRDGRVVEDLQVYTRAVKTVGAGEGLTVIDLNGLSTALLNRMGQKEADEMDAADHADAKAEGGPPKLDRTHLNARGQKIFGRMVADQLVHARVELKPDVIEEPAGGSVVPADPVP